MRRDLRPKSAKSKPDNSKPTNPSFSPHTKNLSARVSASRPITPLQHPKEPAGILSSSSKFLKKYEIIKASRSARDSFPQEQDYQSEQIALLTSKKLEEKTGHRKASQNQISVTFAYPETAATNALDTKLIKKGRLTNRSRPTSAYSSANVELPKVSASDMLFEKVSQITQPSQNSLTPNPSSALVDKTVTAYWNTENKFVTLFPLQRNQNLNYQHEYILPAYAEFMLHGQRFVVSDEYRNCNLGNLIQEFGPFPEPLAKRYLKQVLLGLHHLHYHKRSHNNLTPQTILYNKHGNLLINMIESTSIHRNKEDLSAKNGLFWRSPESLSPKPSRSLKSDIWSLGCLAIEMITRTGLHNSSLHPYNWFQFKHPQEETMIENIRQRYESCFSSQDKNGLRSSDRNRLSDSAISFIKNCLSILEENRPETGVLLEHEFFERS